MKTKKIKKQKKLRQHLWLPCVGSINFYCKKCYVVSHHHNLGVRKYLWASGEETWTLTDMPTCPPPGGENFLNEVQHG